MVGDSVAGREACWVSDQVFCGAGNGIASGGFEGGMWWSIREVPAGH